MAETDRQFSQVRASIRKAFRRSGRGRNCAIMGTRAVAGQRLSLLLPESLTRVGEADRAKYRHWPCETLAA